MCPPLQTNPEIVKRWSNEVQEAVQSRAALVQFHALALLHQVGFANKFGYAQVICCIEAPQNFVIILGHLVWQGLCGGLYLSTATALS